MSSSIPQLPDPDMWPNRHISSGEVITSHCSVTNEANHFTDLQGLTRPGITSITQQILTSLTILSFEPKSKSGLNLRLQMQTILTS